MCLSCLCIFSLLVDWEALEGRSHDLPWTLCGQHILDIEVCVQMSSTLQYFLEHVIQLLAVPSHRFIFFRTQITV